MVLTGLFIIAALAGGPEGLTLLISQQAIGRSSELVPSTARRHNLLQNSLCTYAKIAKYVLIFIKKEVHGCDFLNMPGVFKVLRYELNLFCSGCPIDFLIQCCRCSKLMNEIY
jgi:hypothetical protein